MRSEQNIEDQPTFSKVVLMVPAQQKISRAKQTHKDLVVRYQFNTILTQFYKQILHSDDDIFDIYGFIQPRHWFNETTAIEKIVNRFKELPHAAAIYTDYIDKKHIYLDAFNKDMNPLNMSLFIQGKYRKHVKINQHMVTEEIFMRLKQQNLLLVHIAEPLLRVYE